MGMVGRLHTPEKAHDDPTGNFPRIFSSVRYESLMKKHEFLLSLSSILLSVQQEQHTDLIGLTLPKFLTKCLYLIVPLFWGKKPTEKLMRTFRTEALEQTRNLLYLEFRRKNMKILFHQKIIYPITVYLEEDSIPSLGSNILVDSDDPSTDHQVTQTCQKFSRIVHAKRTKTTIMIMRRTPSPKEDMELPYQ